MTTQDDSASPLDLPVRGTELYMDATDFEHELGNCTVALYASVEDLKESRACAAECGIVAVRVELLRVVEPGMPSHRCQGGKCFHASDCAVHNEPAYQNGACDCGKDAL